MRGLRDCVPLAAVGRGLVSAANSHESRTTPRNMWGSKIGGTLSVTVRCLLASEHVPCRRLAKNVGGPCTNPIRLAEQLSEDLPVFCGSTPTNAEHCCTERSGEQRYGE